MAVTSLDEVRRIYDEAADSYDRMMDEEIRLPFYDHVLGELATKIRLVNGSVLDASCGSGHMLQRIIQQHAPGRRIVGVDLSPRMVDIASRRLGLSAEVMKGDMRDLAQVSDKSCAAVINFFAIHHLEVDDLERCLQACNRVLAPGGVGMIATWEGAGEFSFGGEFDAVTRRYTSAELVEAAAAADLGVMDVSIQVIGGMGIDAVLLWAAKASVSARAS